MGKSVSEYTTKMGTTFHKGDTLRFALGTDIGGLFKYAETPANIMGTPRMALNHNYANIRVAIKDIRLQSTKRAGTRALAVFNANHGLNQCVDLEAAEEVGEIKTTNNQKATPAVAPTGIADELLKLKQLLDAGAISQAEFDAQKAKLLSR